ncbi:NAD(P)/FAD-dependent oxidoreductase [Hydrogenophaga sp.]|jgi:3-phenylpropionate/trans-cinnamate dioxygenase ferredoxin reductase subunit|uniref:NAD(P)/FAD-dependent oxidoreductase n=1 Tax=Hydrogenophaga sp. TaxID=1904254 RepID=UPI003F717258
MSAGLVIVGASYAGLNAAAAARTAGYQGRIVLLGEEPHLPYQRPPLSKDFLRGDFDATHLPIRPQKFFEDQAIELLVNHRVCGLDRERKHLELAGGECLPYDRLVLATGCRPRMLEIPGADAQGIHALRTRDDAVRIASSVASVRHAVIVGGGFIGLEMAASLCAMGKEVTVVESQSGLLLRVLPTMLSEHVAARHRKEGVRLHFDAQVNAFRSEGGRLTAVVLSDGTELSADLALVGIGAIPNQEFAQTAGIVCGNGIVVDEFARTNDPDVFAAGDCTLHPNAFAGGMARLECVQNAVDQGRIAGTNAAGGSTRYNAPPWFWSDQYDMKLQGVGLSRGFDQCAVRGSMEEPAFSVFYFRAGALVGVDSINRPGEHMVARKMLATASRLSPEEAADTQFDLRGALTR